MKKMRGMAMSDRRAGGGSYRPRLVVTFVAFMLASAGAAGCSGDAVSDRIAEEVVEQGGGGDVDVDTSDGGMTIRDDEGNSVVSGRKLPDDFPVDDVPLVEGDVLYAVSAGGPSGGGWSVTITAPGTVEGALRDAADMLRGAGYEQRSEMTGAQMAVMFDNAAYQVLVTTTDDGSSGDATVSYVVSPK